MPSRYDDQHVFVVTSFGFDFAFVRGGSGLPLLLHYGNIGAAHELLKLSHVNFKKLMVSNSTSTQCMKPFLHIECCDAR